MRALYLTSYGPDGRFELRDVPTPDPGPGQVLIQVFASSVNPIDLKIRDLGEQLPFAPELPAILGMDVAGVVDARAKDVTGFISDDKVYACGGGLRGIDGALADYMLVDARLLAHAPASLSLNRAGVLPLVSITAWEALFDKGALQAGESVLVHGGAGGVGHIAVQLALAHGAEVWATVSNRDKAGYVGSLGAHPILYPEEPVEEYVARATHGRGFDLVFDTVGGRTLDDSFAAARIKGRVVSTVTRSTHDLSLLHARSLSLHVVFMLLPMITGQGRERHGHILSRIARLVDEGKVAPLLDVKRFHLRTADQAYDHLRSGRAMGKVALRVQGEPVPGKTQG